MFGYYIWYLLKKNNYYNYNSHNLIIHQRYKNIYEIDKLKFNNINRFEYNKFKRINNLNPLQLYILSLEMETDTTQFNKENKYDFPIIISSDSNLKVNNNDSINNDKWEEIDSINNNEWEEIN